MRRRHHVLWAAVRITATPIPAIVSRSPTRSAMTPKGRAARPKAEKLSMMSDCASVVLHVGARQDQRSVERLEGRHAAADHEHGAERQPEVRHHREQDDRPTEHVRRRVLPTLTELFLGVLANATEVITAPTAATVVSRPRLPALRSNKSATTVGRKA